MSVRRLGLTTCLIVSLAATHAFFFAVFAQSPTASSPRHQAAQREHHCAVAQESHDDPRVLNLLRSLEQVSTDPCPSLMRDSEATLRLPASAIVALAAAEPTQTTTQTACEAKRLSCVAECRARYFAVDPKRDACTANCTAEANRCLREQEAQQGRVATLVVLQGAFRPTID
jgi:hypothetical protein